MTAYKVLLIGSGGREHALAVHLARSPKVDHVFVAPGNGGTEAGRHAKISNVAIAEMKFDELTAFAKANNVNFAFIGPEQPLVDGIVDAFATVGLPAFGPSASASRLEASKAFSKEFMKRQNIPTAVYEVFTDSAKAEAFISNSTFDVVIKASGLAAGKGVILPSSKEEAIQAIQDMMVKKVFGDAGSTVVIEERLTGPEVSIFAFSDGYSVIALPPAQDHKRAFDDDKGPNTGGMGAYAPLPFITKALMEKITNTILKPTIDGMRREGSPYVGLLYAGLMLTPDGPKTLEFNCRFGDPETQAVLTLIDPSHGVDLIDLAVACVERRLDSVQLSIKPGSAVTVVAASQGYPGSYEKGKVINLPELSPAENALIFHAGTKMDHSSKTLSTSGGRVLAVTASGASLSDAVELAYATLSKVQFEGIQFRRDIARQAALHEKSLSKQHVSYADAGVDISAGDELVERIKPMCKSTRRPGCDAELGGFGGLFDLKPTGYKDPILVSSTDGVGTKLRVAQISNLHETVGIDLVAMCVNDLIVQGAEPLLFLDYFATGKLNVDEAEKVVSGIAEGCRQAGCALIGGETAEMPSMYQAGHYDLAGFTVGVADRDQILPKANIVPGDVLIGIASSGLHSNGFSLVRHLVSLSGIDYSDPCPFEYDIPTDERSCFSYGRHIAKLGRKATLAEVLLTPTRMYVRCLLPSIRANKIKALANITGGGFVENVPRVYGDNLTAVADASYWSLPPVFKWLKKLGNVENDELARTLNCGVGMVLVVSPDMVESVMKDMEEQGEVAFVMGKMEQRGKSGPYAGKAAVLKNTEHW